MATPHPLTATELRRNIYRVLDEVLSTGEAQEVIRHGRKLRIVPEQPVRRDLTRLPRREGLLCSPDELIETSWEDAWTP